MSVTEIGIVETRNIIRLINELYQFDFSDFALTSFKRRLENIISVQNLKFADNLHTRLREDRTFFDTFLHEILVEPTEMFRDPSLWRLLRDEYLPQIDKLSSHIRVWFPMSVSGEELFSFLILVKEIGLLEKSEVSVSYISSKSLDNVKSGKIKPGKIEVSKENYIRFHGSSNLENYYRATEGAIYFDESLYKNVTYVQQDLSFENQPKLVDIIFFRNQMLYYNLGSQERILDLFYENLNFNGYLLGGIRERFILADVKKNLRLVDANENIYQKK